MLARAMSAGIRRLLYWFVVVTVSRIALLRVTDQATHLVNYTDMLDDGVYAGWAKMAPQTHDHNSVKSEPILLFSLEDSLGHWQLSGC